MQGIGIVVTIVDTTVFGTTEIASNDALVSAMVLSG
jgi:hypothetical protein